MSESRQAEGTPEPWPRVGSEDVGDFEMFRVRKDRARSPLDGTIHDFHIADSPDGVTVIAITPEQELVLVAQYRHPFQRVLLETPSGVVDEGETPTHAGLRELREETGYCGTEGVCIGRIMLNPSWQTTRVSVVVVRDVVRDGAPQPDEGEDTRVRRAELGDVPGMMLRGEIESTTAISALALYQWWTASERR